MLDAVRHSLRFLVVAHHLARHKALFWVDGIGRAPAGLKLSIKLAGRFAPKRRGLPEDRGRRLAEALRRLGPAYIKLGQMLATRPDLIGTDVALGLRGLQDRLPPFPAAQARVLIADDLGQPIEALYSEFSDETVAAASIAQVHEARTTEGERVAVKVLRPNVEARFRRDLEAFAWAARFAERYLPRVRRLRPVAVVETLVDSVARELDLRLEAAAASELRENMQGERGYKVPVVDWRRTSRRVLTLEWIAGIPISETDALDAAGFDRGALAGVVVRAFLLQTMRDGFFHADLHQGNLFVEDDGTVAALDFGIMGRLNRGERRYLAEILYGFVKKDYRRVADWHFAAGYVPRHHSREEFAMAMRAVAEPIFGRPVAEISGGRLLAQLFATTEQFGMQTQPQLLLLQRSMVMVEGMAQHLEPQVNMWDLAGPVIEQVMREELSPEMLAADAINDLRATVAEVPAMLRRAGALLEELERRGLPMAEDAAEESMGGGYWLAGAAGFAAGAALALLALLL